MENGRLPDGWEGKRVKDIGEVITGTTPSKANQSYYSKEFPFYKPTDLDAGFFTKDSRDGLSSEGIQKARLLPSKSVLVTCIGATIGKTGLIRTPGATNQQINAIIPNECVIPEYLYYACISPSFQKAIKDSASATTLPILNKTKFEQLVIPVAPLLEQERIVAKIEELFTQLEAGTSVLEKVQVGLRRYKASVLKAAVEGKLGIQNDEGGMENGGSPDGWRWTTVGEIADHRLGKMLDKEKNKGTPRPYLRNINVRWFEFDFSDIQEMRVLEDELENISIQKGDLIVCEGGEPGRAAVWNKNESMVIQKALHRVRANDNVLPAYLMYCLAADANSGKLERYFTGSTIKHFTGQSLENYKFLLPPLEEQRQIVAEVERRLSVAREVESVVEKALARAARLRQAVLRSAFEGRLA
jgi:type I restriction enzyme, S subunit